MLKKKIDRLLLFFALYFHLSGGTMVEALASQAGEPGLILGGWWIFINCSIYETGLILGAFQSPGGVLIDPNMTQETQHSTRNSQNC